MVRQLSIIAVILLTGCAAAPYQEFETVPDGPSLGIALKVRTPIWILSLPVSRVFFIKVNDDGNLLQEEVIASHHSIGGRAYAWNVPPGTYAAVAAYYSGASEDSFGVTTYFSEELVKQTIATVGENGIVFMGSYDVYQKPGLWGADALQKHYARLITPAILKPGILRSLFGDTYQQGIALKSQRDEEARKRFINKAGKDLANFRRRKKQATSFEGKP